MFFLNGLKKVASSNLCSVFRSLYFAVLALIIILASSEISVAQFEKLDFVTGFSQPTAMEFAPDGRLFVLEKQGNVRVVKNGTLLATPFLSLSVVSDSERGLVGIAFDPNFASNRFLYLFYTRLEGSVVQNRVSRFTASAANPDIVEAGSEAIILDNIPSVNNFHNGGALAFRNDGKLYIAIGDNGVRAQVQNPAFLNGKILRINKDGSIPLDNPFIGVSGARGEVYAMGLRNPFTTAVDPTTDIMFINDVGEDSWEEINQLSAGANYGWPTCEGPCGANISPQVVAGFTFAQYAYPHGAVNPNAPVYGNAIAGGTFYRGTQFPVQYSGNYFFGDFSTSLINRLDSNGVGSNFYLVDNPVSVKVGPDGLLYYLSYAAGNIRKIRYSGSSNRTPVAVIKSSALSGAAPLTVQFDGSSSSDLDNDPLTYSWNFGDGTPNATSAKVNHTFQAVGNFTTSLTVNDSKGGINSTSVLVSAGNTAPVPVISAPLSTDKYNAGDVINFEGSASDIQDGNLSANVFSWRIEFFHQTELGAHSHPVLGPIVGITAGSFTAAKVIELAPTVWYRIYLTVTDSQGLSTTTHTDVHPNTTNFTVDSVPSGLNVLVDEEPRVTPFTVTSVVGITRSVEAITPQSLAGKEYEFVSWSDSGSIAHTFDAPAASQTYSAEFKLKVTPTPTPTPTVIPTATITPAPTNTPTEVPTATPVPTSTVTPTSTPVPTVTAQSTSEPTATAQATPTSSSPKPLHVTLKNCRNGKSSVKISLAKIARGTRITSSTSKNSKIIPLEVLGGYCTSESVSRVVLVSKSGKRWRRDIFSLPQLIRTSIETSSKRVGYQAFSN